MDVSLLVVGAQAARREAQFGLALTTAGAVVQPVRLPVTADRADLDRALDETGSGRLVVAAEVGDLAAVLRRMWRRGELAERETAFLPTAEVPPSLRAWIPGGLDAAAAVAVNAAVRTVGLLADDSSGLVIDSAELRPWAGRRLWVRAFVDDTEVCDGPIAALHVDRPSSDVLRVTVAGRLRRVVARVEGRAAQLACDDAMMTSDGVERERPRRKRTWWNEPDLWRLAVAPPGSVVATDPLRRVIRNHTMGERA